MKLRNYILLGIAGLTLGTGIPFATAQAKTVYHYIPKAIRGHYITVTNKQDKATIIRKHEYSDYDREDPGIPTNWHVIKVIYSNHRYYVYSYTHNWNGGYPIPMKAIFHHYSKNRLHNGYDGHGGYFIALKKVSISQFNAYFDYK